MAEQPDTTRVHGVITALDQWSRQWLRRAQFMIRAAAERLRAPLHRVQDGP